MLNINDAVVLANKAAAADRASGKARDNFCAWLVENDIAPDDMKAPKKGSNGGDWQAIKTIAAQVVTLKGKRLAGDALAKYLDDTVSAKAIIAGTQKGGTGTSWNGSVTSQISTWRKWLAEYIARGQEATPREVKNDHDYIVAKIGEVLKRAKKVAESDTPDGSFDPVQVAAFAKDLMTLAAKYGVDK